MYNEEFLIIATIIFLILSSIIIYLLAKHKRKYFYITIASTSAILVYALSTLDAIAHGVSAQGVIIPLSIFAFLLTYLWAKGKMRLDE